jgi:hypothetical protein
VIEEPCIAALVPPPAPSPIAERQRLNTTEITVMRSTTAPVNLMSFCFFAIVFAFLTFAAND